MNCCVVFGEKKKHKTNTNIKFSVNLNKAIAYRVHEFMIDLIDLKTAVD